MTAEITPGLRQQRLAVATQQGAQKSHGHPLKSAFGKLLDAERKSSRIETETNAADSSSQDKGHSSVQSGDAIWLLAAGTIIQDVAASAHGGIATSIMFAAVSGLQPGAPGSPTEPPLVESGFSPRGRPEDRDNKSVHQDRIARQTTRGATAPDEKSLASSNARGDSTGLTCMNIPVEALKLQSEMPGKLQDAQPRSGHAGPPAHDDDQRAKSPAMKDGNDNPHNASPPEGIIQGSLPSAEVPRSRSSAAQILDQLSKPLAGYIAQNGEAERTESGKLMRIVLKPDALGELQISLRRRGKEISIRVESTQAETAAFLKRDVHLLVDRLNDLSQSALLHSVTIDTGETASPVAGTWPGGISPEDAGSTSVSAGGSQASPQRHAPPSGKQAGPTDLVDRGPRHEHPSLSGKLEPGAIVV